MRKFSMKKNLIILTIVIIASFLFVGTVSASDVTNTPIKKTIINPTPKNPIVESTSTIKTGSGCCFILIHVKKGYDVFAFRRDSTYSANLYFQHLKWYGKDTIKEYKTTNGYFFHTIISKNGWIVSTGGPDVPYYNRKLEDLAGRTSIAGYITRSTLKSASSILRSLGMGHFLIKAPNDDVGLVIYNGGSIKKALFKMTNGEYVSVPNSPYYYRNGYTSTSNPIASAINLATTDRWGLNRRNIITYQIMNINYTTQVKIYASTCRGTPDNIFFLGQKIGKYTLPRIPNKKYIGEIILKSNNPKVLSSNPTNMETISTNPTTLAIKFNEKIKTSTNFNKITLKNLITNKIIFITKTIYNNILNIKTTILTSNTLYQVTIFKSSIKDYEGNDLTDTFTFKFKTS